MLPLTEQRGKPRTRTGKNRSANKDKLSEVSLSLSLCCRISTQVRRWVCRQPQGRVRNRWRRRRARAWNRRTIEERPFSVSHRIAFAPFLSRPLAASMYKGGPPLEGNIVVHKRLESSPLTKAFQKGMAKDMHPSFCLALLELRAPPPHPRRPTAHALLTSSPLGFI